MKSNPINHTYGKPSPCPVSFGWQINENTTKMGNKMLKETTYLPNNGLKLLVTDVYKNNKRTKNIKQLFDTNWNLLKQKVKEFVFKK